MIGVFKTKLHERVDLGVPDQKYTRQRKNDQDRCHGGGEGGKPGKGFAPADILEGGCEAEKRKNILLIRREDRSRGEHIKRQNDKQLAQIIACAEKEFAQKQCVDHGVQQIHGAVHPWRRDGVQLAGVQENAAEQQHEQGGKIQRLGQLLSLGPAKIAKQGMLAGKTAGKLGAKIACAQAAKPFPGKNSGGKRQGDQSKQRMHSIPPE